MTRILLVDDLFENQEILAEIMSGFGIEYAIAGSVKAAIDLATSQPFDAVIMDLGIPNTDNGALNVMGGLEASRAILAHPGCRDLPIIAFTNRRVKDVEQAVRQAGLKAVLEKGPSMDLRLLDMLHNYVTLPAAAQDLMATATAPVSAATTTDSAASSLASSPSVQSVAQAEMQVVSQSVSKTVSQTVSKTMLAEPALADSKFTEAKFAESKFTESTAEESSLTADSQATVLVATQERIELMIESSQTTSMETNRLQTNSLDSSSLELLREAPVKETVGHSDETAVARVKSAFIQHLQSARIQAELLQEAALELEVDDARSQLMRDLHRRLTKSIDRLQDPHDTPSPGEPLGHWIGNLIIGAHSSCQKLARNDREHFGKFAAYISRIASTLDACYELCRSEESQIVLHPRKALRQPGTSPSAPATSPELSAPSASASTSAAITTVRETSSKTAGQETQFEIPAGLIPKPLVLVVDDENDAREYLEAHLKELDEYEVVSCNDPFTALKMMDLLPIDVCLLDLDMPGMGMDGLELIDRIRQSPRKTNTSIIVVSGSQKAVEAIERGADDYITKPADIAILSARIKSCLRKTQSRIEELSKFLPLHVLKSVLRNSTLLEQAIPADISVIVCDIRGFSRVSERIGPVQTIAWVSDVMNELSQVILSSGGTIVDYVGDEIMAMWGAPIATTSHAEQACRCAMAIQAKVDCLVEKWRSKINCDFSIGVGINSGLAVVGNTGSKLRFKYGPLGDTVNVASRIQGATKYLHSRILVSQNTSSRISSDMVGRRICSVRVKNINEPVNLFELLEDRSQVSETFKRYETALQAFEEQRYDEAIQTLAQILSTNTEDGPSKLLMARAIQAQLGGNFDPVWTLPGK